MPVSFQHPEFLLALLIIPVIWGLLGRSAFKAQPARIKGLTGGVRTLIVILFVLALADPRFVTTSDRVNAFFCLDVSESARADKNELALEFINQAKEGMGREDMAGLIVFGREPSLETALTQAFGFNGVRSQVNANFTSIYQAIQLAVGKLPRQGLNKIVLLTDGNQNLDDSIHMAHLAGSLGIEIYPIPLESWFEKNEVFFEELVTPPRIPLETPFNLRAVVRSTGAGPAGLILLKDGKLLSETEVNLSPGKNVFHFKDSVDKEGLYLYKAVINAPYDAVFQNNEGLSFTRGAERSRVLYLSEAGAGEVYPADALSAQGLDVVRKTPAEFPGSIQEFLDYSAVILDNVPGHSLPLAAMDNLDKYVRDTGGGLVVIGGDRSYGAGDYLNTPIEKSLPVFMDVPSSLELAGFCLVLVIDKSASMAGNLSGENKLEGAKIAAFSTITLLNPMDKVGLLAFDVGFNWIVPITEAGKRQEIAEQLSTLKEGGGTELYPALREAHRVLTGVNAARKHIIVLSDGLTGQADFKSLIGSMARDRISVSTVALGSDSDRKLMEEIAEWGQGRTYYTNNVNNVPNIFTGETRIASKRVIVEKNIRPSAAGGHDIISGLTSSVFPLVRGMVVTYPKPGALVVLNTAEGPLLAAWRYGLGHSAAFTSDLSGRWGRDWVMWDRFGQFVVQMVRWTQRKEPQSNYKVDIARHEGRGDFTVEMTDDRDQFINDLDLQIKVLLPSKLDRTISLHQTAPGRYQGSFPAEETGEYYLSLFGSKEQGLPVARTFGLGVPYTDEFLTSRVNYDLLKQLASITDGRMLSFQDDPEGIFKTSGRTTRLGHPTWPFLAIPALLLLLADVLIRKIIRPGRID